MHLRNIPAEIHGVGTDPIVLGLIYAKLYAVVAVTPFEGHHGHTAKVLQTDAPKSEVCQSGRMTDYGVTGPGVVVTSHNLAIADLIPTKKRAAG